MSRTRSQWVLAAALALSTALPGAALGAEGSSSQEEPPATSGSGAEAERLRKEVSEALEALQQYSYEQRQQAAEKTRETLEDLDRRIQQLRERLEQELAEADEATRERTREALRQLERSREQLGDWYLRLRDSSAEAWNELRDGLSDSLRALQRSFEEEDEQQQQSEPPSDNGKGIDL